MKRIPRAVTLLFLASLLPPAARPAVLADPVFAGIWSPKDPGGIGGLFFDQSWDELVANWQKLGGENQYLAEVEAYRRRDGRLGFAGLWRVGPGNGGLLLAKWPDFLKAWKGLAESQELIDLERVETDDGLMFLGVWRRKPQPAKGGGALLLGLGWNELVAKRDELGGEQYLTDVETYSSGGKRLFDGVWRVGRGNGGLFLMNDWSKFVAQKKSLDATQEMLDFEMFPTEEGEWSFLGVWRSTGTSGPLDASLSSKTFKPQKPAQFVETWQKLRETKTLSGLAVVNPRVVMRGDTTCEYGDPDCNRCATDVAKQFRLAFETGHRPWIGWEGRSWKFNGDTGYPPDNLKPEDAFFPYEDAIVAKHVQGFVRTNSSLFPYAGSHSHKKNGSIFFIAKNDGKLVLRALYKSPVDHPSGVAVLGDGLFVAEGDVLRWIGIDAAGDPQKHSFTIPRSDKSENGKGKGLERGGGGIGLAKLRDGSTLLIASAPGGGFRKGTTKDQRSQNLGARHSRFFRLVPDGFRPDADGVQFLGTWRHQGLSARPDKPLAYSENLSVVTECGSGRIYTIHTTGDWALKGDGYWHLSRVEEGAHGPDLVHVAITRQAQHNEKCHHRSAATVHVDREGRLEFLCTERAVIKWHPTGEFNFREGKQ